MFDVFGSVKGLIKLDAVCIDNNVFRLHYKATFIILIVSSLLVTSRQYIGDPIDCIVEEIPNNVMDTYCWIHSTFSVPNKVIGIAGEDNAHPGVAPPNDLEDVGARYEYSNRGNRHEKRSYQPISRLFLGQSKQSSILCHKILSMRSLEFHQRIGTNLFYGLLFGRRIYFVRIRCYKHDRT